jgi:hypothetical protein
LGDLQGERPDFSSSRGLRVFLFDGDAFAEPVEEATLSASPRVHNHAAVE